MGTPPCAGLSRSRSSGLARSDEGQQPAAAAQRSEAPEQSDSEAQLETFSALQQNTIHAESQASCEGLSGSEKPASQSPNLPWKPGSSAPAAEKAIQATAARSTAVRNRQAEGQPSRKTVRFAELEEEQPSRKNVRFAEPDEQQPMRKSVRFAVVDEGILSKNVSSSAESEEQQPKTEEEQPERKAVRFAEVESLVIKEPAAACSEPARRSVRFSDEEPLSDSTQVVIQPMETAEAGMQLLFGQ